MLHCNKIKTDTTIIIEFWFTEGISFRNIEGLIKTLKLHIPNYDPKISSIIRDEEYCISIARTFYKYSFTYNIVYKSGVLIVPVISKNETVV